ncbi:hypothetical protein CMO83_05505 [Candidatus Woesearchaeota archaeon]|jgi:hypothetical protein|nr:hypothetical protein [Candidatus Woesearchaeota archaeon]|tara:strand:- start:9723 stop:11336 length:1614 start_codon:yes stop_codon:yes gene_type:complete
MKISRNYLEAGIFILVYLFALYLWTLPFQDNASPYGEFDAISHWELGDFIAQRDRTFVNLPPFLDYSYGDDNKFKPHTLWYPPPFHTDFAIISVFSNDRVIPIFLTNAIFASSILISVFFAIRKLYGFLPAILSSFILTFSMRDILPYIWGQWPERFAYAFIPLILYAFYMYYTTYSKDGSKPIYLYIMSLLLAVNLLVHPLVFFHSAVGLFVLGIALFIKDRKIPFNVKHLGIALILFVILLAIFPYQTGNVFVSFQQGGDEGKKASIASLFSWAPNPADFAGSVPTEYFSFGAMHGLWTLPFLLIGLGVLLVRRERRDIFLLAWLISLYLILHRDLIGKATFLHRSLSATAHIFIPITVIGAVSIPSLIKLPQNYRSFLKYGLAILVVALALVYNLPNAFSTLNNSYDSPLARLNPSQIEASEWLRDNIGENQNVSIIGPPPQILQKVWWMASYSHRTSAYFEGFLAWKIYEENREEIIQNHLSGDYLLLDYTDISLLSDRSLVNQWQAFEQNTLQNHTLLYNKNNIRVYKYEAS